MKDIVVITTDFQLRDDKILSDGFYNIQKHGQSFIYDGKTYTYHSSGLCRMVYLSDCGKYVIKVPSGNHFEDVKDLENWLDEKQFRWADLSIKHNYYEAKAYEACPKEYKKYLAKTKLLPNCWILQEFVEVKKCQYSVELREIGKRKNGSLCIFDFDPLLTDYVFVKFRWEKLPVMIAQIKQQLKQ